jgi:thioredoxin
LPTHPDMKKLLPALLIAVAVAVVARFANPPPIADHPLILHPVDADFRSTVAAAPGEWVLVDLWAPWCGPCKRLKPLLNEFAPLYHPRLGILAVNVDQAPATADFFGVRAIPCLVLLRNGTEVDRIEGLPGRNDLKRWLDGHLAAAPKA